MELKVFDFVVIDDGEQTGSDPRESSVTHSGGVHERHADAACSWQCSDEYSQLLDGPLNNDKGWVTRSSVDDVNALLDKSLEYV